MNIGENIKTRRKALGITREELAKRTKISFSQLSKIETDGQKNPTIRSIIAISTALQCSIDELIFKENTLNSSHLNKLINELPEKDKDMIKKIAKGMALINQAESMMHG
ncbi:helix-turn-helix domain-containing protein [Escherichia coli]|uniref:helix-turn-helix domain-containing protein n=1 Tax=Escherichia coli TaxID=562 RepID=UPI0010CAFCC9|nr:helix-turn-helix transcriptional regulator [Escherichia coli]GCR40556.1 regulator for DicB [Escherichia coli]